MLTPGVAWGEMDTKGIGDLDTIAIVKWISAGDKKRQASAPSQNMSVSGVAGAGFEPATFRKRTNAMRPSHAEAGRTFPWFTEGLRTANSVHRSAQRL